MSTTNPVGIHSIWLGGENLPMSGGELSLKPIPFEKPTFPLLHEVNVNIEMERNPDCKFPRPSLGQLLVNGIAIGEIASTRIKPWQPIPTNRKARKHWRGWHKKPGLRFETTILQSEEKDFNALA